MNDQRNTSVGEAPADEPATPTPEGPESGSPAARTTDPNARDTASRDAASRDAPSRDAASRDTEGRDTETDALRRERDEFKDLLLRKTAEFENYRRRVERERRELTDYAVAELLRDILPLADDLERALAAAVPVSQDRRDPGQALGALQNYRTGVELINRQLQELLRKRGVTPIEAVGTDFDPHLHQAVTQEPSAHHREGEVMAELARGYKLGDRLLRPAMVKVATRE